MKRFSLFLLALIGLTSLIAACANQGAGPDGGPYDETPPRIVGMTAPERLQNGKRTKFSLVFNELIKVDNPTEKIIVSPPQIETPEIKVSGRRITVELLDSMRPNTTYTVDFSDAITDNNEGNPLGQYTYIFSTGQTTDTMQMSGYVLNAEDLEPVKGILAGLYQQHHDSVFGKRAFDRVARTDASGFFSIKGVAPDRDYRLYALQDADGDFHFTQPSEMLGFLHTNLRAGAFRDTRYDTLWVDSVRYDSIRIIPYTHFTPDDLVVRAFKINTNTRHYLKAQRDVPELFTTFFTGPSRNRPTIKGLNFDASKAFVVNAGKIIFFMTVLIWFLQTHGLSEKYRNAETHTEQMAAQYGWDEEQKEHYLLSYRTENSLLGNMGKFVEPVFRPLGYDWKISISVLGSFAARETFVSTLATIYSLGEVDVEEGEAEQRTVITRLQEEMRPDGTPMFNLATGVSILLFFASAMQCISTFAIVRKETNSWKWTALQFLFMTGIAYISAMLAFILIR